MKSTITYTDKVEDLNGTGYATGHEVNSSSIHPDNVPNEAMLANFRKNCALDYDFIEFD